MSALRQIQVKSDQLTDRQKVESAVVDLTRKMDEVKGQVYETMMKHYKDFIQAFDYALDLGGEVAGLARDLKEISLLAEDAGTGLIHRMGTVSETHANLQKKLKETDNVIHVLERLCRIHEDLSSIDSFVDRALYPKAAFSIQRVNALLSELNPEDQTGCDAKIFTVIRNEARRKKTTLKTKLETLWVASVVAQTHEDPTLNELTISQSEAHGVSHLQSALQAMSSLGILDSKLELLCKSILTQFLLPMVSRPTLAPSVKRVKGCSVLFFREEPVLLSSDGDASDSTGRLSLLLKRFHTVLLFLCDTLFARSEQSPKSDENTPVGAARNPRNSNGDDDDDDDDESVDLALVFGRKLWPLLHPVLVGKLLASAVPTRSSEARAFSAVAREAFEFEEKIVQLGLLEPGQHELVAFAKNIHDHFATRKHEAILVEARSIIVSEDHNTVTVDSTQDEGGLGGKLFVLPESETQGTNQPSEETPKQSFQFPTCQITVRTKKLVQLAYDTLEEATQSSVTIAVHLFNATRDIFELYRAVAPVHHASNLEAVPLLAVLFHNDCMYIAHHLVTLGLQFKARLPPPMNATATFIDMIVPIKQLGEECFVKQIDRQKSLLLDTLVATHGMRESGTPEKRQAIEKSLRQVVLQLQHLQKVWKNVLPSRILNACIGHILDGAAAKIVADIMAIPDIGEEETLHLHELLGLLVAKVDTFFELSDSREKNASVMEQLAPNWKRLVQTSMILTMSLAEITERWLTTKPSSAGSGWTFTPAEMSSFVRALFLDTPLRQRALVLFQSRPQQQK